MLAHRFEIEADRDAPQQIRERNFSRLWQGGSPGNQFRHFGEGSEGSARLFTDGYQAARLGRGSRWNRNQDFVDSLLADYFRPNPNWTTHWHAQNPQALCQG